MKDLLRSKKFRAALAGLIVAVISHFGLSIDPDMIMVFLSPLLAFIAGQGLSDIGKERAKIEKENS